MQRARALAVQLAIADHFRLERRILLMVWRLARRWARVTPDVMRLEIPITHDLLSDLLAAHRPSVTVPLNMLHDAGLTARQDRGWLLRGEPLENLDEAAASGDLRRQRLR